MMTEPKACLILGLALALNGCAGPSIVLLEPPADPAQYAADLARCQRDLALYQPPGLDLPTLGYRVLSGAAGNAAAGVVGGPLVPAVGALGGLSDGVSQGLDFMGSASAKVLLNCVRDLTARDGSALIATPN